MDRDPQVRIQEKLERLNERLGWPSSPARRPKRRFRLGKRLAEARLPEGTASARSLPIALVSGAILFNLIVLRAERLPVANLNDSALHESMVEWARQRIAAGHLPFDGWFPDLQLGSGLFHHYQSLPHVLTGYLATLIGTATAFGWVLYLLLALWPISVYLAARLLGLSAWASALAAVASPLLTSTPGYGYEYGSYVWRGWGMWSQLWGMWLLPFAWALTWRAIRGRGSPALAALAVALTVAFHFLTGYLAFLSIPVLAVLFWSDLWIRIGRALLVFLGAMGIAAWVIVPVLVDHRWIIQDEFSIGTFFHDSYGARKVLGWLFTGQLFDGTRFPILTVLLAVGVIVSLARFRRDETSRAVPALFLLSLLLFFGRPTIGPILQLLPGSGELFLHRYIMGVHLAGIFLIGIGSEVVLALLLQAVTKSLPDLRPSVVSAGLAGLFAVALLPGWTERAAFAAEGRQWIDQQRVADQHEGAAVDSLIQTAKASGPGRIYAGLRGTWGAGYVVGQVPVYSFLLSEKADGVGFTLRTASLSAGIEARFNETDLSQYEMLDIRYLLLPEGRPPPVQATLLEQRGNSVLWEVATTGYLEVVDTTTPVAADRTNLGQQMEPFLGSGLAARGIYPSVAYDGQPAAPETLGLRTDDRPGGRIIRQFVALQDGVALAEVDLSRPAALLLKASFDPRWRVLVDGTSVPPQMIAPSFVGIVLPAGHHQVVFEYAPYPYYGLLFMVGIGSFLLLEFGTFPFRRLRGRHARS